MNSSKSVKSILKNYCDSSSLHGPAQLIGAQNKYWRCLWTILVLGTTGYMGFQLSDLFTTYYSWPVTTTMSLGFSPQSLPAISICNMNSVRKSQVQYFNKFTELINKAQNSKIEQPVNSDAFEETTTSGFHANIGDTLPSIDINNNDTQNGYVGETVMAESFDLLNISNQTITAAHDGWDESLWSSSLWDYGESDDEAIAYYLSNTPSSEAYKRKREWKYYLQKLEDGKRIQIGHQLKNMLVQCTFGNKLCSFDRFTDFWNVNYGNCFTFSQGFPKIRTSGEDSGLSLILNIEKAENVGLLETGYGVRLTVHENGSIPFPSEHGITLSAGQETYIGLHVKQLKRMHEPYGDCIRGDEFMLKNGIQYSSAVCKKYCLWNQIASHCTCDGKNFVEEIDTILKLSDIEVEWNISQCGSKHKTCVSKILNEHFSEGGGVCHKECRNKCRETIYTKTISSRQWPSGDFLVKLQQHLCSSDGVCTGSETPLSLESQQNIRENFVKVKIYFEDLNYEKISEEPMYEPVRFLSDIGGTLGLFIGASLLSGAEVLCLIMSLIEHGVRRMFASGQKTTKVESITSQDK